MAHLLSLNGNTILITGGGSGIGLELANTLSEMGNTVIICGRTPEKLETARKRNPRIHTVICDVSDEHQRKNMVETLIRDFSQLNILINNAVTVNYTKILSGDYHAGIADQEIQTNYIGPVGLITLCLDHLKAQQSSAIINMTTGLVLVPHSDMPGYCASKAALHSFTQSLRHQLKGEGVRIIEILMTAVDTGFHDGGHVPDISISPEKAVSGIVRGLRGASDEIKIGKVNKLSLLSRIAPRHAFKMVNAL